MRTLVTLLTVTLTAGCSLEPSYVSSISERSFACYVDDRDENLKLKIEGHEAVIVDGGKQIVLKFVPSLLPRFEDRFEGDGHVLILDPEAFHYRPDGTRRGPCL